jgi:hypothetical protein
MDLEGRSKQFKTLHKDGIGNLYSSASIYRIVKSRKLRLTA